MKGHKDFSLVPGIVCVFCLMIPFLIIGCAYSGNKDAPPPEVVSSVDLQRYMGTWYEIARYPNSFQKDCFAVKATYKLLENGRVSVFNQCRLGSQSGELTTVKGVARVVDPATKARLKVSFFWPFSGDYWIIELGKHYEYAVVGHPKRTYLWILCRNRHMDDDVYRSILERLENEKGYNVSKLIKTLQPEGEETPGKANE